MIDSKQPSASQPPVSRRDFLAHATAATTVATLALALPVLADGPNANDGPTAGADGPAKTWKKSDFKTDGLYGNWIQLNHFLIVRENHRLYALTSICTHRGCDVAIIHTNQIQCPCHRAQYQVDGTVTKGPARRPLGHLGISVDGDGIVVVDSRQHFAQPQWDDPASFIALDPNA